jgi:tetratricopeptide (TPR) repeat protein
MRHTRLACGLLTAASWVVAAPTSASWRQLRSSELTLVGNASEGDLKRTLRRIDLFRSAVLSLFPEIQTAAPIPTTVVVFKDFDAFSRFQPRDADGKRQENVGGYLLLGSDSNFLVFGAPGASSSIEIAFHEYAHYLMHLNTSANLPGWLDEGIADFYSTFDPDYKGRALIGRPPGARIGAFRAGGYIPLRQIVSPRDMEQLWKSPDRIGMFYAESWALVHYVLVARKNPTPNPLSDYLKALSSTNSQDAAFKQAFGVDVDGMDEELRRYVRHYMFKGLLVPQSGADAGTGDPEPMTDADVHEIQGRLLALHGAFSEAEKEVSAALKLDPSHTNARVSLAFVRRQQDRNDEAVAVLQDAVRDAPSNVRALYQLGMVLLEQWRSQEALDVLDRALQLNRRHAASWIGLGAAALSTKRDAQARAALIQAARVQGDPGIYRDYAWLALRVGRDDVAADAAQTYMARVGLGERSGQYGAFLAALAWRRAGQPARADAALAAAEAAIPERTWTASVLQFLQGRLDADRFIAAAKTTGEKTEAHTYVGFRQVAEGAHDAARAHFKWVVEHGAKNYGEHTLATNELARLNHAASAR